jgi:capsular polysaccharide export protein
MLKTLADVILHNVDPGTLLPLCDAVWTMTSTLGFEALLRGKPVTCFGVPFYAGWGLTTDLHPIPKRRRTLLAAALQHGPVTLTRLVHAALISYPRYFDPVTRQHCPPEVAVDRLISGPIPRLGLAHRSLAKLQGHFASFTYIWR